MDEQPHGPPPQTRWSLEHTVAVLHQNGFKLKLDTLSKFEGGVEFEVYSAQDSYGQSIVFKYPRERWVYNDNDYGIDRCQLLRQERDLLRFAGEHGIPVPEVLAYFDPHDGPVVLVLEQINVDGTLPSDTEIGETPWRHAEFVLRAGQSGGVDRRRNHRGPLFLRRYLRVSERPASRDAAAARCNRTRKSGLP